MSRVSNLDILYSIVLKFYNHPSTKMIKHKFRKITKFSKKDMKNPRLDNSSSVDIPPDIKKHYDLCFQAFTICISQSITETR